jgi:hypothetical protein
MENEPDVELEPEIRFDRDKHRCFFGKEQLSAVGSVLRKAAEAFNPWAKDEKGPEAVARMARGTAIHETIEAFNKNELVEADDLAKPYLEAWKQVMAHYGIGAWLPEHVEEWTASKERLFWGIIDVFDPESGRVLEIKTGTAKPWQYRIATAGYCILKATDKGSVVYLSPTGIFDPSKDIEEVTVEDFNAFEMALELSGK